MQALQRPGHKLPHGLDTCHPGQLHWPYSLVGLPEPSPLAQGRLRPERADTLCLSSQPHPTHPHTMTSQLSQCPLLPSGFPGLSVPPCLLRVGNKGPMALMAGIQGQDPKIRAHSFTLSPLHTSTPGTLSASLLTPQPPPDTYQVGTALEAVPPYLCSQGDWWSLALWLLFQTPELSLSAQAGGQSLPGAHLGP